MVISVVRVLSVFHFWLKLRPRSLSLYLVSRWPPDFPVSVLLEPEVANSCKTTMDGAVRGRGEGVDEVETEAEETQRHMESTAKEKE